MKQNYKDALWIGGLMLLLFVGFTLSNCDRARARGFDVLAVVPVVPTVAGIPRAPVPGRAYDPRAPRVNLRPGARAYSVDEAPPNNCGPNLFEVVSGPEAQRGCYGFR